MGKKFIIGFIYIRDSNWIGGTYYIENIISAFKLLPPANRPFLKIYCYSRGEFNDLKSRTEYDQMSPVYIIYRNIFIRLLNRIAIRILGKHALVPTLDSRVDILFPANNHGQFKNFRNKFYWIPDFQEYYYPDFFSGSERIFRKEEHQKIIAGEHPILFSSNSAFSDFKKYYKHAKNALYTIPFAVTLPKVDGINLSDLKKKYSIMGDYYVSSNQFWAHKNHIGLLLAVQILRDRHNLNLPIVFVGADKGNQKYIEQVVTDLQLEQVYFLGFVEQEQLVWLYLHAFALVFPTFFGPDNLPPLEAFALGCPVIASRVAGAVEQLGNAALLFDPTRPEELAIAIESLWSNLELRQGFIDRGLLRAHEWTAINYVQNICQILDEFALIRRCWINSQ